MRGDRRSAGGRRPRHDPARPPRSPLLESAVRARIRPRRPEAVLPRPRAGRARALARAGPLRPHPRRARRRADLVLLRGPADRQRPPRLPPRPRPRLQGHLPALPHDVRVPGAAQSGLGLPRAAGRAGGRKTARHLLQGRDRGLRDRRVQPALPRVGLRVRRGVEPADRADRLLGRPRRPLRDAARTATSSRSGGRSPSSSRRAASTRATRSSPTARATARRSPRTRSRRDTRTSTTPRSTCASRWSAAEDESLLVWTTTPWTLPGNKAVAVNPAVTYVRARVEDEILIVAARPRGEGARRGRRGAGGARRRRP